MGGWGGGFCGDGPKDDNTEGVSGSADSGSCNLPVRPSPKPCTSECGRCFARWMGFGWLYG